MSYLGVFALNLFFRLMFGKCGRSTLRPYKNICFSLILYMSFAFSAFFVVQSSSGG